MPAPDAGTAGGVQVNGPLLPSDADTVDAVIDAAEVPVFERTTVPATVAVVVPCDCAATTEYPAAPSASRVRVIAVGLTALFRVQVYLVIVTVLAVTLEDILSAVDWLPVMVNGTFVTAGIDGLEVRSVSFAVLVRSVSFAVLVICRKRRHRPGGWY